MMNAMEYSPPSPHRGPMASTKHAEGPAHSMSKRDKRRGAMSDRLAEITNSFTAQRDVHYRRQLQALQVDMNLILQADVYASQPLEDSGEEIAALIGAALSGQQAIDSDNIAQLSRQAEQETGGLAGRWFSQFVNEVNNCMEDRDAALTLLKNNHTRALQELQWNNEFKVRLAKEEHRQLASTVRERLIQNISQKKARLLREKELLDLADSNALLLHPNQFSITNPVSPGGPQSNRKTRHTRYRTDMDDLDAGGNKRKRKATADENNDTGSPAPIGRVLEPSGGASPFRDARSRATHPAPQGAVNLAEAPAFSIERLFTEKELTMHYNAAHMSTAQYFANLKAQEQGGSSKTNSRTGEDDERGGEEDTNGSQGARDDEAGGADMERTQSYHATRSTRNGGLNGITGADLFGSNRAGGTWLPVPTNPMLQKKSETNTPGSASRESIEDDLAKIERIKRTAPSATDRRLLDEITAPIGASATHNTILSTIEGSGLSSFETTAAAVATPAGLATAAAATGGVPMSASNSLIGSDLANGSLGGVPMTRNGEGGSAGYTKRSASGAGLAGDLTGKRARR